jgi:hypothetical protein
MMNSKIDYTKLNDQIVKQAYRSSFPAVLSKEDTARLIAEKIERARLQSEALEKLNEVA